MKLWRVGTSIALLALLVTGCSEIAEPKPGPNIILIVGDDWGYGDLGVSGNPAVPTPSLDRLAAQGTRFTQFYAASTVCSPSRAALLTGRFPAQLGIHAHFASPEANANRKMPDWLDPAVPTLPRILRRSGYATAHFGKWHLGGGVGGSEHAPPPSAYGYDEARVWNGNGATWEGDEAELIAHSSQRIIDASIAFAKKTSGRFFINVWLQDLHFPLKPSADQRSAFSQLPEPQQTYFAALREADRQIGRLLDWLRDTGREQDTVVIFTSDQGPELLSFEGMFGDTGGLRGRKRSLYEGGIRVPFLVRWPGHVPTGAVNESAILGAVDLLPTLCAIANVDARKCAEADGEDAHAALLGRPFSRSRPLHWEWRFAGHPPREITWPRSAVRDGRWKLLTNPRINRFELYNLDTDPAERSDQAQARPHVVHRLSAEINAWQATLTHPTDSRKP